MRHGNEKEEFETGAQRDTNSGKGKPSLISPVLIHRTSVHLAAAEEHYPPKDGSANWMKGIPYRRTADSIIRHIFQWLAGDKEEDHLAAISCNTMFLMHFEEAITNGGLPVSLDDRDKGLKKILSSILTSPPPDATLKPKDRCEFCGKKIGRPGPCLACASTGTVPCRGCKTLIPRGTSQWCLECQNRG